MNGFMKRYMRNYGAVAGLVIVALVVLVALCAPLLYEESPWMMVASPLIPPFTDSAYPFGTDMLGRDITAGLVWGARVSLMVGLLSAGVALLFGIAIGAIAGYCGGRIDDALMRFTEFFQTIPQLAMAVVLVAVVGPSVYSIMGAIALVSWPPAARLVRSEFMTLKQREFVQAAIVIGQTPGRIVCTQILPNAMSPIIVSASFMVATAILTESSLSFLGLGDRNLMSWGFMIGAARTMIREAWWMSVWPGVAILLTVLAINLIGEGLNDALNPQLRASARIGE
ncbi:ABC transporter permease [Bordetella pertussis]